MSMTNANGIAASGAPLVGWLIERAPVAKAGQLAAAAATDADTLLKFLLDAGHSADAIKVVAAALPPREGVWWAWASATHASRLGTDGPSEEALAALAAAERWIAAPDDQTRRSSWAAAERAGTDTPAGSAAAAPFFITGSIGPVDIVTIPPPPGMHTTMIGLAVILSAAADASHFDALARAYIAQGLEVIKQLGGWQPAVDQAKAHFDAQREQHLRATTSPGA